MSLFKSTRGAIHLSESFKLSYALDEAMQAENHWRYGPKPAAYICSDKYRPKRGAVTLASMATLTPNSWPVVLSAAPEPELAFPF